VVGIEMIRNGGVTKTGTIGGVVGTGTAVGVIGTGTGDRVRPIRDGGVAEMGMGVIGTGMIGDRVRPIKDGEVVRVAEMRTGMNKMISLTDRQG
jgi:hypothetical protein